MKTFHFASADIDLHDDGLTVTRYPHGEVQAAPRDDDGYMATAVELGYGKDTARMSREHELTHNLLAHWLGLAASPTLFAIAAHRAAEHWSAEEDAVKAIQRFARLMGVDIVALAEAV